MKIEIKPYREEKLKNRLKGWHRHFRGRFQLLQSKTLTKSEYILWDCCFSVLADWDSRHPTYKSFDFTNIEIAYFIIRSPEDDFFDFTAVFPKNSFSRKLFP